MRLVQATRSKSPEETVHAGLRILARIIAREAVKERLAKVEGCNLDPCSNDAVRAEVTQCVGGAAEL